MTHILKKRPGENWFSAFTLVELIIVITILAILASIAFVSFWWYVSSSRDANRVTTLKNIETGLVLYAEKTGEYPMPENQSWTWIIEWNILSYVWEIGEEISRLVNFNKKVEDPGVPVNYVYGITSNKKEYQVATFLENGVVYNKAFPIAYAEGENYQAKVEGNYNGYIKFSSGSDIYIANMPSILFNNTWSVNLLQNSTYYVVNKKKNLPYDSKWNKSISWIGADSLIKELTRNETSVLTGVKITWITANNFETYFSGDILKSFNVAGSNIWDIEVIKETVKTWILWWWSIAIPKVYATCTFLWQTVAHEWSVVWYKVETIDKFSSETCDGNSEIKTCTDGVLSWSGGLYQYGSCVKWVINNCSASGSYVYNGHTYNISALNHGSGATNTLSSDVSENNWMYKYTLTSISCNDGELVSPNESGSATLVSCNSWYHSEDTQTCVSDTKVSQLCTWKPANSVYNTATSITQTWNGSSWSPSTTATYNATSSTSECRYTCATWFMYQSWACNDITVPTWWDFTINWWATSTNTTAVTLNITCPTDAAGSTPIQVAYGNTASPTNWTTCTSSLSHTLTSGDGTKTVYVRFRDSASVPNVTSDVSRSISLSDIVVYNPIWLEEIFIVPNWKTTINVKVWWAWWRRWNWCTTQAGWWWAVFATLNVTPWEQLKIWVWTTWIMPSSGNWYTQWWWPGWWNWWWWNNNQGWGGWGYSYIKRWSSFLIIAWGGWWNWSYWSNWYCWIWWNWWQTWTDGSYQFWDGCTGVANAWWWTQSWWWGVNWQCNDHYSPYWNNIIQLAWWYLQWWRWCSMEWDSWLFAWWGWWWGGYYWWGWWWNSCSTRDWQWWGWWSSYCDWICNYYFWANWLWWNTWDIQKWTAWDENNWWKIIIY